MKICPSCLNASALIKVRSLISKFVQDNLFSLSFLTFTAVVLPSVVMAEPLIDSIFSCQAQGLSGTTPIITVGTDYGTNLSFIRTQEVIKKVWLDDPSQIVLDFDGSMCGAVGSSSDKDCENSSATVVHLRRIKPLAFPNQFSNPQGTLLTVITEGGQGRKVYPFRVIYRDRKPKHTTLMIFPDPGNHTNPCVRLP